VRDFAILCPGQGTQSPEMFDFATADPAGREVIAEFSDALGNDLLAQAQSGVGLFDNRFAQPAMVAVARAVWATLAPRVPAPALFAGYSVGEVSSWSCAGAWDSRGSAVVAQTRARLMDAATPSGCGMLAVLGMQSDAVKAVAEAQADLYIAIVNDLDHVVLAGVNASLDAADALLRARGAQTRRLDVRVPSHTPMLAGAARELAAFLQSNTRPAATATVLRGVDGQRCRRSEDCAPALSRAVSEPIRWVDCMREIVESGVTVVLELGPGRSLSRLCSDACPDLVARSVADFRSPDGVAAWLERQLQA
jgi:[acyl-carrier-protein] S-malonyltransferase